jgi:hypothetical protein
MEGKREKGRNRRDTSRRQPMIDKDRHQTQIQYASENLRYHAPHVLQHEDSG